MSFIKPSGRFANSLLIGITWIPVALAFNENVCYIAKIQGSSMMPTLNPSKTEPTDWVLLWKWGMKNVNNIKHNDVVLIKAPSNPRKVFCKRVKGKEFDSVQTRYPYPREIAHIPRSHIWVEGDNAFHSIDSNNFGPVSTGLVLGKAIAVIWPPSRWNTDLNTSLGREDIRVNGFGF